MNDLSHREVHPGAAAPSPNGGGRQPQSGARYRAPAADGAKLFAPPWHELGELLEGNLQWRRRHDFPLLGQPLSELAASARAEIAAAATRRGSDGRLLPSPPCAGPLIVTGHQPGLVHPGVWVKNFAAASLARAYRGASLHVVVDADLCRSPAVLVPAGSLEAPRAAPVEFDGMASPLPWEERPIDDARLWETFPHRVRETGGPLLRGALLEGWWPSALEEGVRTGLVGASLAAARQRLEAAWGVDNAELAQSRLCQTAAFRRFACQILLELPRFVEAYNGVLREHRRANRVRNHAHPVPDLASNGAWLEAPFWIWTAADRRRRPLFVRREAGGLLVSDRQQFERLLPLRGDSDAEDAIALLGDWEAQGAKLRSRALITTMFTRLAVADLFLHGIGGAKYDETTDAICQRFFGAAPPAYAALSGTLRLPISQQIADPEAVVQVRQQLRELAFHPERILAGAELANGQGAQAAELVAAKRRWISAPRSPEAAAARHQGIVAANQGMQLLLARRRQQLDEQLAAAEARSRASRVLDSREYAFCLFPAERLQKFLLDFPSPAL